MTPSAISRIVSQVRKTPEVLVDVIKTAAEKAFKAEDLATFIDSKLVSGEVIERADDIRREYEE